MVWVGTSLLTRGVVFQWASTKDWSQVGLVQDGSSTYTPTCSRQYDHEWLKADYKPDLPPPRWRYLFFQKVRKDKLYL